MNDDLLRELLEMMEKRILHLEHERHHLMAAIDNLTNAINQNLTPAINAAVAAFGRGTASEAAIQAAAATPPAPTPAAPAA